MFRLLTAIFFVLFISLHPIYSQKKAPIVYKHFKVLDDIRKGKKSFFQFVTYPTLVQINDFFIEQAREKRIRFVDFLVGSYDGKWRKGVVQSAAGGLYNRDPRVRLYVAHLLLKLSPKREWFEKDLQKALDPEGMSPETVDRTYEYFDIYGRYQYGNVKDALYRLLELGNQIIFLSPKENEKMYQNHSIEFEWSTVYGSAVFDLYIDNVLYYRGESTILNVPRSLGFGSHKWEVIAKDRWGKQITSNEALFYINEIETPRLRIAKGLANDQPKFKWNKVRGASEIILYYNKKPIYYHDKYSRKLETAIRLTKNIKRYKRNKDNTIALPNEGRTIYYDFNNRAFYYLARDNSRRYFGEENYFTFPYSLKEGDHVFYLVAHNVFQHKYSYQIQFNVVIDRGKKRVTVIDKSVNDPELKERQKLLEFDLRNEKDISIENKKEVEEEITKDKELQFDIKKFQDLEKNK